MHRLPARDATQGEPHSYASLDGTVYTHIDLATFDFYVEVRPDYDHQSLCDAITQARWWGLELIEDEEDEPELLDDGSTRIYLSPIIPEEQVAPLSLATVSHSLPSQRGMAPVAAMTAAVAGLLVSIGTDWMSTAISVVAA